MLITLGRGLAPAGKGTGNAVGALPHLTDLVPGLTANWEPYYANSLAEALIDTTGNGHHMTAVGSPTLALINGAANGLSLNGLEGNYTTCHSIAQLAGGVSSPYAIVWVVEQNTDENDDHWGFRNSSASDPYQSFRTDVSERYYTARRDDFGVGASVLTGPQVVPGCYVLILSFSGSSATLYRNGNAVPEFDNATISTGRVTWNEFRFGLNNDGFSGYSGKAALCAFMSAGTFAAEEVATITNFLKLKYGI